jgi:hypothetical protein
MQGKTWQDILTKIPKNLHNTLMLVTSVGIEIAVQQVFRMESDYLLIRGRLAGTTDAGRAFFIPYESINQIGFYKEMKENQLRVIYGEPELPETKDIPLSVPASAAVPDGQAEEEGKADESVKPSARPPEKQTLIERLRARRQAAMKQPAERVSKDT